MKLRYITCSDPREHIAPDEIINLLRAHPMAEVAVQAHPSKMSFDMARHLWFDDVVHSARNSDTPVNLAVHVNMEWANAFCRGVIVPELLDWFFARDTMGKPLVRRWQINIHGSKTPVFMKNYIAKIIANNPDHEFIFQYGASEYDRLRQLYDTGVKFSVLYDTSGGRGITATEYYPPLFTDCPQGYSGGISPENVTGVLDKIAPVTANRNDIWIDAEGKLKDTTTNKFDMSRARAYINAANQWHKTH